MTPKTYNFKTQYAGDTFRGLQITVSRTSNSVTTPEDLSHVNIVFTLSKLGAITLKKEVGSGISLVDAVNGVFKIDSFTNPSIGNYVYDIEFRYPHGVIETYLTGSFKIIDKNNTCNAVC